MCLRVVGRALMLTMTLGLGVRQLHSILSTACVRLLVSTVPADLVECHALLPVVLGAWVFPDDGHSQFTYTSPDPMAPAAVSNVIGSNSATQVCFFPWR
jgi:hypothetical protein